MAIKHHGLVRTPDGSEPNVRLFDFRRPSTMSREHVRTMQIVQDGLARGLTTVFAGALRAVATVTVRELEQFTYDEYVRSVPNPTLLTMLSLRNHRVGTMLEFPLPLAFAATELLLGGTGAGDQPKRAMTDLELSLMRNIVDLMLPEFKSACEPIMDIDPEIMGMESNPQFAQLTSASEMVILMSFDVKLEEATGTLRFCMPFSRLQPYLEALSASSSQGGGGGASQIEERARLQSHLGSSPVEIAATLRPASATSRQIVGLEVGDVIMVNHPTNMPLAVHVQGVGVYEALLGRVNRQLALQIYDELEPGRERRHSVLRVAKAG